MYPYIKPIDREASFSFYIENKNGKHAFILQ